MEIYDYKVKTRDGKDFSLASLKGKVLIIVNTATGCGFTPQYEGLENLYKTYHDQGLEILDFPCDQFGHQAPGTDDEIHNFCVAKYQTTFDQFAKIEVNGDKADPLYQYLKSQITDDIIDGMKNKLAMKAIEKMPGVKKESGFIKWNFTKFLVDKNGKVVARFSPTYKPEDMEPKIKQLLADE
ncbi:glutathione peroxidase [Candidatus Saccharibacteria bacterium]|nr:glutathione peroxidase [Candidatus Saccharibacteria bacterium]